MPKRNTKFLIDTNVFIAAVKKKRTTDLLLYLLTSDYGFVTNHVLLALKQEQS